MNNYCCHRILAIALIAWAAGLDAALAETPPPPPPPSSFKTIKRPLSQPVQPAPQAAQPKPLAAAVPFSPSSYSWQTLLKQPPFNPGAMQLLTDGTLMVHDQGAQNNGGRDWWRLTPDVNGSYLNGKWSKLAPLPSGYAPLYFASAVLPDGRVIVIGGEYNNGVKAWTNRGAIYDPLTNRWKAVSPPPGSDWLQIGAAASTVLANGTFMIGGTFTKQQALFNPVNLSWTITGSGKADINNQETWTLLPNGDVLTIDANNTDNLTNSERYLPGKGSWVSAGSTIVKLVDINKDGSGTHENGPQLLQPDGTVFAAGATGHTAVYISKLEEGEGYWKAGPDFPVIGGLHYAAIDGPAALLPSGKVLVAASPGPEQQTPTHFFVFDGTRLDQVGDTLNAAKLSSYYGYMILLPTGQVMFNSRFGDVELFTETGHIEHHIRPVITQVPTSLVAGKSYALSGKQLNGLSQGAAYAEGYAPATNYPLVRIVNAATQHVFYARTSGHSGMPVTPWAETSTNFTIPAGIETGAATLYAVANGIASLPVSVTVSRRAAARRLP